MSKRFDVSDTPLSGLPLIQRQRLGDSRGSLERVFCAEELAANPTHATGWNCDFPMSPQAKFS